MGKPLPSKNWCLILGLILLLLPVGQRVRAEEKPDTAPSVDRICTLIETHAEAFNVPKDYFARLIWKESRFDHKAVSPVGAQGIAQFMPATAKERGLIDPFDITQAIPASASLLSDLKREFGNWGLAAAAYNAGSGRVSGWLARGGFLPLETEGYVADITGRAAVSFAARNAALEVVPLDKKLSFGEACRQMRIIRSRTVPMSLQARLPWGIQVAGNFRRSAALRQWRRVRKQNASVLRRHRPVVQRKRSPRGRRGIYAVRIGVKSRARADKICRALRSSGGACIVTKN